MLFLMASASGATPPRRRRLRSPTRLSIPGVLVAAAGAAAAIFVSRATGAGWLPALGLAALLAGGLYLFARDEKKGWGDLGEGVMVSVIVAIALMAVQRDAEEHTRKASERRDHQLHDADARRERQLREAESKRQQAADRQSLQLALTLQTDLQGIALRGRDMAGFFLAHKNLNDADLRDANLTGADLRGGRFRRTNLLGADLDNTTLGAADLRDATLSPEGLRGQTGAPTSLRHADLEGAVLRFNTVEGVDFTGAMLAAADLRHVEAEGVGGSRTSFRDSILIFADFAGAYLGGVDFRGATLGGARFCNVRALKRIRLKGAIYDARTRWPSGFDPATRGAKLVRGERARSYDFHSEVGGVEYDEGGGYDGVAFRKLQRPMGPPGREGERSVHIHGQGRSATLQGKPPPLPLRCKPPEPCNGLSGTARRATAPHTNSVRTRVARPGARPFDRQ